MTDPLRAALERPEDIFDRLMSLWQEPWSELAFGEAQMLVARLRTDTAPLDRHEDHQLFHGHHPACDYTIEGDWSACCCGAARLAKERDQG